MTFPFEKYLGHGLIVAENDDAWADDGSEGAKAWGKEDELKELPEGARLRLDVIAAKERTLRRPRFVMSMEVMPGRDHVMASSHLGMPPGSYTGHLPLPDADLDGAASWRRRIHQVSHHALEV